MTQEGATILLRQLVESLEGELAGVLKSAGSDLVEGVTFFVPVVGIAEVADEVEHREIGAIHQGYVVVEDGAGVRLDPVLQVEF